MLVLGFRIPKDRLRPGNPASLNFVTCEKEKKTDNKVVKNQLIQNNMSRSE